ncbi:uncharacterized protein METZ01_LOCUS108925, partial [marine metagenome]
CPKSESAPHARRVSRLLKSPAFRPRLSSQLIFSRQIIYVRPGL